ncbi:MAG: hypothetical protein ACP5NL_03955 [Thermoplasmata archaeon]
MKNKTETLELMKKDLIHGSSWYFDRALELLKDTGIEDLPENLEAIKMFRPMGTLANIVEALQGTKDEQELKIKIENLKKYRTNAKNGLKKIAAKLEFRSFITISYSSAILSLLEISSPDRIYLMESRPGSEARKALKEYSRYSEISVVPDSAICGFIEKSGSVIIGADGIYSAGFAINKIGSRPLILCAKTLNVPVYVAMESYKACNAGPSTVTETDFRYCGQGIKVPLFEKIPLTEISHLITDAGIFADPKPSDIKHMHDHFIWSISI